MQQRAREKHDLILLRHDPLIASSADSPLRSAVRIVKEQFPALKLARLAMEEVNERDSAGRDHFIGVIAVRAEEVPVIAGRDLSFRVPNRKLFDPKLVQHSRQHATDSVEDDCLVLSQIHEHPRAAMIESNHPGFSVGRDYLAALELLLMLQRVGNKFVKLLRSQELIQDNALRASDLG